MTEDAQPRAGLPDVLLRLGFLPLAMMAVILLAFLMRAAPLALDPVRTTNAADQFDTARALARLERILGDETPHPVDSDALDITRARLLAEIRNLGYAPQVMDQTACRSSISGASTRCARVQNIMFSAGPETGPTLMLAAHYDSVDAAPGAADDGIGIAVWLEVAHHLRQNPPDRPVLFLFTDGEETALLGAQAFVDANAHGREIWRIINLEARGVTGPAMMFETSRPNSAVVLDWSRNGARPFSDSLMTSIYELLPNSTDLSVWLAAGWAGVNIAISDGVAFYHTSRDSIAMLDHKSVQHMGDQALGATRAFLASTPRPEGEIVYADIASRVFVSLPQGFAVLLLGLCAGMAGVLVLNPARDIGWRKLDWRAFALPPVMIVAATALAWAALFILSAMRPEPGFWTAHPQWLNLVYFLCALLAAALGLAFLAPNSRRETLFASGWFWFLAIGAGSAVALPGIAMLFLISAIPAVIFGAAARFLPVPPLVAWIIPALAALIVWFPMLHLLDSTMGLSIAPAFGFTAALALATLLGFIGPIARPRRIPLGAIGAGIAASAAGALMVPAYSVDKPLALNIVAHADLDTGAAHIVASAPPAALPPAIAEALPDTLSGVIPGFTLPLRGRPVELRDSPSVGWFIDADTTSGDERTLTVIPYAPDARTIRLRIPPAAHVLSIHLDGAPRAVEMADPGAAPVLFECVGRSCDGRRITIRMSAEASRSEAATPWIIQGYWSILPREAMSIAALRPETALPIQTGDITIATRQMDADSLTVQDIESEIDH